MSQNPPEPVTERLAEPVGPPELANSSKRRVWLLATAALAAAAGTGLAWHRLQGSAVSPVGVAVDGLWALQWQTPQGSMLAMRSFQGRPLLLNFWATWCPPCVEELPRINAFYRRNARTDWQVLGLALDNLTAVQAFLQKTPLDFPVGLAGLAGAELARSLGNLAGALPFSVVIGSDGSVLARKMGPLSDADLDAWIGLK